MSEHKSQECCAFSSLNTGIFLKFYLAVAVTLVTATSLQAGEPITPIPDSIELDWSKVSLGEKLFHDGRLSSDGSVSCATCHSLDHGGVDGLSKSSGVGGKKGDINSPTVLNSSLNFVQFWDGRAKTLEQQIDGPIHNPVEMATNWPDVVVRLKTDANYVKEFANIYSQEISQRLIKDAIATFERSLLTPGGPFDRFLLGESDAISKQAQQGYRLFKAYGCSSCHQGAAAGGNMYAKLGNFYNYYADKSLSKMDYGRYNITGVEADRFKFKVPSLRNVTLTAPYLHNGSIETVESVVRIMGRYQLGRVIPDEDISKIVSFLGTLTGKRLQQK